MVVGCIEVWSTCTLYSKLEVPVLILLWCILEPSKCSSIIMASGPTLCGLLEDTDPLVPFQIPAALLITSLHCQSCGSVSYGVVGHRAAFHLFSLQEPGDASSGLDGMLKSRTPPSGARAQHSGDVWCMEWVRFHVRFAASATRYVFL